MSVLVGVLYFRIVRDMVMDWYRDDNYSHGFIIPLISGYFVYERRRGLKSAGVKPWNAGILVVVFGLLQLGIGYLGAELFTMRLSLIVVTAGLVLYLSGKEVFSSLLLPLLYLIFMIPLPYIIYDSIAFPLKLFVAKYSVMFLKSIGIAVWREGNIIMLPDIMLEVADACSGIRSLISLLALSVAFAFFSRTSNAKKWLIVFSALPIAVVTNGLRVVVTGIVAQYWSGKAAEGFFHEFAGLLIFVLASALLLLIVIAMRKSER